MENKIKNARIFIVDDEPRNVELLRQVLLQHGYLNIRATTDSREVLEIYKEFAPDIILLDLRMPYLDGFEVMRQLKEFNKDAYLPILILTAEQDNDICLRALSSGGKDFMGKPINLLEMLTRVNNLLEGYLLQKEVSNQNIILEQKVKERTEELHSTRLSVIQRLGRAAEYRDNETGNHVIRMSRFSSLLAKNVGLGEEHCDLILNAAPMHDIGKIGIPDSILLKPGKLNHDEWKIMKTHTAIGAEILSADKSELLQMAQQMALQHHEKFDGTGYPNGLKGEEISLEARIVTTSDIFDALTSERPYKNAWSVEDSIMEMEKVSGTILDPNLVTSFKKILPEVLKIKSQFSDSD
ncbi:MAG: two-component system response regulator [Nitrospinae bacterium CG11_big_fil_rev_8_21_14_0_20_45_15]|nr:MAG: two-component system response regulator [Nitrospinae bacterium CG11_big_fil_rev_8_21_14_0_20_45_15]